MSSTDYSYEIMLSHFQANDLLILLSIFKQSTKGQVLRLRNRAMNLLTNTSGTINNLEYRAKIQEIYNHINIKHQYQIPFNMQQQRTVQRVFQPPRSYQRLTQYNHAPVIIKGRNVTNNHYNNQPTCSRYLVPNNQRLPMVNQNTRNIIQYTRNYSAIETIPSGTNIYIKKHPFYDICNVIYKPIILNGYAKSTLPNASKISNFKEASFSFILPVDQINRITLNRDTSNGKNEYLYQVHMRICWLKPGVIEMSDLMPIGINVRICDKNYPFPKVSVIRTRQHVERQEAKPIDITSLLKLAPMALNKIIVNWIPDGKTYIIGVYLVKKLNSTFLIEKLFNKTPKCSKDTKNYIIKRMANLDPDLTTTSYRVTLLCPLGKTRMKIPVKSINCDHLQCFDANNFILMNEKKSKWVCPICDKRCLYEELQRQSYFLGVLRSAKLPEWCNEIELLADGTWKVYKEDDDHNINLSRDAKNKKRIMETVSLIDSDDDNNNSNTVKKFKNSTPSSISKVEYVDLSLSD